MAMAHGNAAMRHKSRPRKCSIHRHKLQPQNPASSRCSRKQTKPLPESTRKQLQEGGVENRTGDHRTGFMRHAAQLSTTANSESAVNKWIKMQSSCCMSFVSTMSPSHAASKPSHWKRQAKYHVQGIQSMRQGIFKPWDDRPRGPNQHSTNVNGPLCDIVHGP